MTRVIHQDFSATVGGLPATVAYRRNSNAKIFSPDHYVCDSGEFDRMRAGTYTNAGATDKTTSTNSHTDSANSNTDSTNSNTRTAYADTGYTNVYG
jgi:hypothetical protein